MRWGLDPAWHRQVPITIGGASDLEWSILDTGEGPRGTIVCVHGNPTWGYLWRDFLRELSGEWRVIAVDQTGMGWSSRATPRTLEARVAELVAFCQQHTSGPLVLVAHDWGGPVALGAISSLDVRAVILGNTGVALPEGVPMPPLIATARRFVDLACRRTGAFVDSTALMTAKEHRSALRAPYRSADRRRAVADFVADIPLSESDVSWQSLQRSAGNLEALTVPLLLVWGGRDPVFSDRFLADLVRRAPHADVHRFPDAGHLVPLDEPMARVAAAWLDDVLAPELIDRGSSAPSEPESPLDDDVDSFIPITRALLNRSDDDSDAFTDASGSCSWRALAAQASDQARMLVAGGLAVGDRVILLVPPSAEMLAAAYGVWLAGGVVVVADSGLGITGLRRLLRGSGAKWVFGTPKTLSATKVLRWAPGARMICTQRFPGALSLPTHRALSSTPLPRIVPESEAAIVHTSGSTGPAKPVRYRHRALAAQREAIAAAFAMSPDQGFLTSFAPFIVLGPGLGVPCVLPDIDVTSPSQLDFDRFAHALASSRVDVAWLSPASARRIVATASGRKVSLRLVMLAGAPISPELATAIAEVTGAEVRSPWGMTEAMPLTDGVGATRAVHHGTVTGEPLTGAEIVVLRFGADGSELEEAGEWGELAVRARWMFDGYERQWASDHSSVIELDGRQFHRTGDLGFVDENGDLHQLGRVQHLLHPASGPVPCVIVEQPVSAAVGNSVAVVGIGPVGTQAIAVVIEAKGGLRLAGATATSIVRDSSPLAIAAVLEGELPVDVRHESKIKRDVLAESVAAFLAGR